MLKFPVILQINAGAIQSIEVRFIALHYHMKSLFFCQAAGGTL